jgi:hypothetical protein
LKRLHHCLPISHTRAHITPPSQSGSTNFLDTA